MNLRVVFFGTPDFAVHVLSHLVESGVNIVAVVTQPDQPKGRSKRPSPPPVKERAQVLLPDVPIYQPEMASNPEFAKVLESFNADLFIVVAYGEIIKQNLLDMPRLGCINVHPSLLPLYRGAAPLQRSLMDGVKETGVAIMHMVKKMDAGDIIEMEKISVSEDMTYGDLEEKLSLLGAKLLVKVIDDFAKGDVKEYSQDESQVIFAPKIQKEDLQIDWNNSASKIHNQIRALSPKPGAFCFVKINEQKKRLKILKSKVVEEKCMPGEILSYDKNNFTIACGSNAISILELQLEGKQKTTFEEFTRGVTNIMIDVEKA